MTLKIFIIFALLCNSIEIAAQLSLKTPLICHNKESELRYYDDGSFRLFFEHGKFSSFTTYDSCVRFTAAGRYLEIKNVDSFNEGVKIQLIGSSICLSYKGNNTVIDSVKAATFFIDDIGFSLFKQEGDYTISFQLGRKMVSLNIDVIGYPNKKWTWDMITIKEDSSYFGLGYNPFHDAGPSTISRQDQSLHYGINIANSFKTNKYVWRVYPVFYEETEKSHIINLLSDFYYEYNRKGKLKPRKCKGEIRVCASR